LTKLKNSNGDRCAQRWGHIFSFGTKIMPNYVSKTLGAKGVWVVKCLVVRCSTVVGEHFITHKFSFTKGNLFKKHNAHLYYECFIFQDACPLFYFLLMILNRYPWISRQFKK
jgi:hypothetical protein